MFRAWPPHDNPHLTRVLENPSIASALEAGRMHEAYRLLCAAAKDATDPQQKQAIEELLGNRRLFIEAGSPPGMGSFNGVGVKLYGQAEPNAYDGTFISTLYFIVVFVPVFPLAEYWVRPVGSSGFSSQWQIFGKAPMSRGHRLWQRVAGVAAGLAMVTGVSAAAIASYRHSQRAVGYATNDLDVEVALTAGPTSVTVPAHGHVALGDLPKGHHRVEVTCGPEHRVLESYDLDVKGGEDALVVNVLGASPVFMAEIVYSKAEPPPKVDIHAGERVIVLDDIDLPFQPAPDTIQTKAASETRRQLGVEEGGWQLTVAYLRGRDPAAADALARSVVDAQPDDPDAVDAVVDYIDDAAARLAWLDAEIAKVGHVTELERARQRALYLLGRRTDAEREYRARWEASPSDPEATYLYAVTLPYDQGIERMSALEPKSARVHASLGWRLLQLGRNAEAAKELEATVAAPKFHVSVYGEHVAALVAEGRFAEAISLAERVDPSERVQGPVQIADGAVIVRAKSAGFAGAAKLLPERLSPDLQPDGRAYLYSLWGADPGPAEIPAEVRAAVLLHRAARTDPTQALRLVSEWDEKAATKPYPTAILVLAAEAARRGDKALGERAFGLLAPDIQRSPGLRAFILEGIESSDLERLPLESRAILEHARARREPDEAKRKELLERAKAHDALLGFVRDAATSWPSP